MTSTTFFIIFIPILSILLLVINLLLSPHNPYQEKDSAFECGFHSFLGQNRTQFSISFFIFALLFLLFDLEILLVYPYSVSGYNNDIYGLSIMIIFFILLTWGFVFELGKNALTIDSKQTSLQSNENIHKISAYLNNLNSGYKISSILFGICSITLTLILFTFFSDTVHCHGPNAGMDVFAKIKECAHSAGWSMITPTDYTKLKVDICDYIAPGSRYRPFPYVYHEAYSGSLHSYYKCNTCPAHLCDPCYDKYQSLQEKLYQEELRQQQDKIQQEIRDNASDAGNVNNIKQAIILLALPFSIWNMILKINMNIFINKYYNTMLNGQKLEVLLRNASSFYKKSKDYLRVFKDKCTSILEWASHNPPKPHAFTSLPLQSSFQVIIKDFFISCYI